MQRRKVLDSSSDEEESGEESMGSAGMDDSHLALTETEGTPEEVVEDREEDSGPYSLSDFEHLIQHHQDGAEPPTSSQLWGLIDQLGDLWLQSWSNPIQTSMNLFGLTYSDSQDTMYTNGSDLSLRGIEAIETAFLAKNSVMLYLHMLAANSGMLRSEDHKFVDAARDQKFCRCYEAMRQNFIMLRADYRARSQQMDILHEDRPEGSSSMLSQQTLDFTVLQKSSPKQWVILYCLQESFAQGLRKRDDILYAQQSITPVERVMEKNPETGELEPTCAICHARMSEHPTALRGRLAHAFETRVREIPGATPIKSRAWKPIHEHDLYRGRLSDSTIASWVHLRCSKDGPGGIETWYQYTKSDARSIAEQLEHGFDNEMPRLRVERLKWSFYNGVFDGESCRFFAWGTPALTALGDFVATKFVPIWFDEDAIFSEILGQPMDLPDRPEHARFGNYIENRRCIACGTCEDRHRFNCETPDFVLECVHCDREEDECTCDQFDPYRLRDDSWMNIKTPIFDSILRFQRLGDAENERDVWKWLLIYMGRLFHPISSKNDDWQVCLLIKGMANTGKSTLGEWVMQWFLRSQIGTLSNNVQEQFGLETITNADGTQKQLVVCLETKGDFKLSQTELQSIITGESVSVIRKGMRPIDISRWEAPMFLLGNEIPGIDPGNAFRSGYKDNSGSLSRRFIIVEFTRELADDLKDGALGKRLLHREGAALLAKCLLGYKCAKERYGALSTWGKDPITRLPIMPACFHANRTKMRLMTNSLEAFLNNPTTAEDSLSFRSDAYISSQDFIQCWRAKCTELSFATNTRWTEDLYCGPFARYKLKVVREERLYPPVTGQRKLNEYVIGIGRTALFPPVDDEGVRQADSGGGVAAAPKVGGRASLRWARSSLGLWSPQLSTSWHGCILSGMATWKVYRIVISLGLWKSGNADSRPRRWTPSMITRMVAKALKKPN